MRRLKKFLFHTADVQPVVLIIFVILTYVFASYGQKVITKILFVMFSLFLLVSGLGMFVRAPQRDNLPHMFVDLAIE